MTGRRLLALWMLVGVSLLAFLGGLPVLRTQEARVLETAREILEHPGSPTAWLLPELNGISRLRKPPLPYWLSAGAFLIGGVSEGVGRVPTALVGWLLVGVTFATADRLLGRRAAFFSATALATSYLFFKHTRLAETDAPAALFVTVAVYALLRAADAGRTTGDPTENRDRERPEASDGSTASGGTARSNGPSSSMAGPSGRPLDRLLPTPLLPHGHGSLKALVWHHLAAVAMGLAFNAKGLPGLFPLTFLVAFAGRSWRVRTWCRPGHDHRWDVVRRFLLSGAPLTLLVVGGWWYAYAAASHPAGVRQFARELREVSSGEGHGGSFLLYFPRLLGAMLPWSGLLVVGVAGAVARWRTDAGLRTALVWLGAILLPLLLTPNKQFHYLFPLMPPAAMLVGWAIDVGTRGSRTPADYIAADSAASGSGTATAGRWAVGSVVAAPATLQLTLVGLAVLAVPAVPVAARVARGSIRTSDVLLALGLVVLVATVGWVWRRREPTAGIGAVAAALVIALPVLAGAWYPTLTKVGVREVAADVLGVAPYEPFCFYGNNVDLSLVFHLHRESPVATDANRLTERLTAFPDTVIITTAGAKEKLARPPAQVAGLRLALVRTIRSDRARFELYRAVGPAAARAAAEPTSAADGGGR